jgi:hypothetical protein
MPVQPISNGRFAIDVWRSAVKCAACLLDRAEVTYAQAASRKAGFSPYCPRYRGIIEVELPEPVFRQVQLDVLGQPAPGVTPVAVAT